MHEVGYRSPGEAESTLDLTSSATSGRALQLFALSIALGAAVYSKSTVGPIQETMRAALQLTDNQMALLQGAALGLPMLVASVPLGLLIDRKSRARLLMVLVALVTIGSALTALASNFVVLFTARALVGLAAFAIAPTTTSLLADWYPPAERGRAIIVTMIGQYAGVAAAFGLGGSLLSMFASEHDAWRVTMLALTGPLVVVLLAMLALREPARKGRVIKHPSVRDSMSEFWSHRTVVGPLLAGIIFAEMAIAAVMVWAAPTLSRRFGLAPADVGAIMAIAIPVGGIAGAIVGGLLADFCQRTGGPRRTVGATGVMSLICIPAGLFAIMPGVPLASIALIVLIGSLTAICVVGTTVLTVVIPNELRGLCISLLTGLGALVAIGMAPLVVSSLSSVTGGPATIGTALAIVCVIAGMFCAAAFALARRTFSNAVAR
jgi:MFS family permease